MHYDCFTTADAERALAIRRRKAALKKFRKAMLLVYPAFAEAGRKMVEFSKLIREKGGLGSTKI